jgi:hypothetical protein
MPQFAFGLPTMVAYPPPPPLPQDALVARPRPRTSSSPASPPPRRVRSRSWHLLHDCLCLPDYHIMKSFYDARRKVDEMERPAPGRGAWTESPVAIGLLLTILPPLGVTLLWASRRFSRAAKIGVTAYAAAVSIAALALVVGSVVA